MNGMSNALTTTGFIATLLSILFAVASVVIAHRRKTHHARGHALPSAASPATPASTPSKPSPLVFRAHPDSAPEAAGSSETRSTSSPLFKRLGRAGLEENALQAGESSDDQLIWE